MRIYKITTELNEKGNGYISHIDVFESGKKLEDVKDYKKLNFINYYTDVNRFIREINNIIHEDDWIIK